MSPMEPRIQQLRQLDLQRRARETRQGMDPMEALRRMLEQGQMSPDTIEALRNIRPTEPRYEEPVPPPPPRLEDYYGPTTTPFPGQDTAPMPEPRYEQDTTPPAIYPLDTIAPQMPQLGGVTLSNGQFIAGVPNEQGGVNIGTPDFFQQYAGNPDLMRALSDAYGYDVSQPRPQTTQAPQVVYGEPTVGSQGYDPGTNYGGMNTNSPTTQNPQIGYSPETNYGGTNDFQKMMEDMRMQERMQDPRIRPDINPEPPRQDPRINPEPPRPIYPMDMPPDNIGRRLG